MTSQINPNNIDGTYPVAGQPNNTQGMRDNFTATKTNFQYAADEINDLQNKSVLKAALAGSTLDNNMNDNLLYAVKLNDVSYTYIPITTTSGSVEIDYSAAGFQQINVQGNISLNFTNWPAAGSAGSVRVGFNITDVTYTVTLPAVVSQGLIGLQGVSPGTPGVTNTITFGAVGNYAFEFVTVDSGSTVWIFDNSRPIDVFASAVSITNSTAASSTATGALVVDGGVGISGNLYVGGTIVGDISITGVSVTGNVVGGNINTGGVVSATGNINGGNINSAGRVTAVGNITGGNLNAAGLSLSGNVLSALNVTGNIVGGNVRSAGTVSAAGNITGGNIVTLGSLSTAGSFINSNITTTGNISATGNITGATLSVSNVIGNVLPITDNIYTLGNITQRWESLYLGPGTIFIQDTANALVTAELSVTNGVLLVNGADQLQVGQLKFVQNTIQSTTANINIQIGEISDTANLVLNRNVLVTSGGGIGITGTGKVGYNAGAGGTVTQLTNKSTGVTLNKQSGEITTSNATLNGDAIVSFTLTNNTIANTDVMIINHVSGGTVGRYFFQANCGTGNAVITIRNATAGAGGNEGAALVLRYAVIKGATT